MRRRIRAVLSLTLLIATGCVASPASRPAETAVSPNTTVDLMLSLHLADTVSPDGLGGEQGARELGVRTGTTSGAMSALQFGRRFGLGGVLLRELRDTLRVAGLPLVKVYRQRTAALARGTAAAVERFFDIELRWESVGTRSYVTPSAEPTIPDSVDRMVSGVILPSPPVFASDVIVGAVTPGGLRPDDAIAAYEIQPLRDAGYDGRGQTVAIISFAPFGDEDLATYERMHGLPTGPPPRHIPVGAGSEPSETGALEANLDVQVVRGIAPGAQILNYEIPGSLAAMSQALNQIVEDGEADIVSMSFSTCDDPTSSQIPLSSEWIRQNLEPAVDAAAATGIQLFASTGDYGAYQCHKFFRDDHRPMAAWPAGSPNVVAVGGTLLFQRADGGYLYEAGWEDALSGGGAGGGLNPVDAKPAWQAGPGVNNAYSNGRRQLPDVGGPADADSGFAIITGGREAQVGGTSAATPFWAGLAALLEQYAQERRIELPQLGPLLYRIASTDQPFPPFNDVIAGGNLFYECTPGWDYVTGLGTPRAANLAEDIVRTLKAGA